MRTRPPTTLLAALALSLCLPALAPSHLAAARAQVKRPITKDGLLKAVRINGLSTQELVEQIQQRGVSFQMTPSIEAEMRAAGARPEVIAAARSNYRRGVALPTVSTGKGRAPARVAPAYDDLTDQATYAIDARDYARASQLLQQAISVNASQPRAYQLLGFTELYLRGDLASAERHMRAAIERGGSAAFRVYHDHASGSFQNTCAGSLFVTSRDVTFKADDGADTFAALDPDIREIKTNRFVGRNPLGGLMGGAGDLGAFHIKVKRLGENRNYNFAPLTKKKKEAELIIGLVRSYGGVKD